MTVKRGKFIVLEGIDGSGTTTVGKELTKQISNLEFTFEPSNGRIGQFIRRILKHEIPDPGRDAMVHLFTADRMDHVQNVIEPLLEEGTNIIGDRYSFWSTAVYQSVDVSKDTHHSQISARLLHDWLLNGNIILPDLTLYLDVCPSIAKGRRKDRGDEKAELYEKDKIQEYVGKSYRYLYDHSAFTGSYLHNPAIMIDAAKPFDKVVDACALEIYSVIKES